MDFIRRLNKISAQYLKIMPSRPKKHRDMECEYHYRCIQKGKGFLKGSLTGANSYLERCQSIKLY